MNLIPIISKIYPEGSVQGQCGDFAHRLINFPPIGNTYASKKKAVQDFGVLAPNLSEFRIGDVVITNDNTNNGVGSGHVAVVADIVAGQRIAAESNFQLDGRVHYGRVIPTNRIYGVLRGDFRFPLPIKSPLELDISIMMQYQKPWQSSIFQRLTDRMLELSGNRIKLNVFPLYTYRSLKNWNYKIFPFGTYQYSVIDYDWYKNNVLPLSFANLNKRTQIVLWAINREQWQGTVFGAGHAYDEVGWTNFGTNPIQSLIVADEGDKSFQYPNEDAFIDYCIHECQHGLQHWGRTDNGDDTDKNYFNSQRELSFNQLNYQHLAVNLL